MIRAVFFDVGETLVNEARMWGELSARMGVEAHVIWAALGAVVERGEPHWRAWERIGVERPEGGGFDAADLYDDAEPCLRRLRDGGLFVGLAGDSWPAAGAVRGALRARRGLRGGLAHDGRREAVAALR